MLRTCKLCKTSILILSPERSLAAGVIFVSHRKTNPEEFRQSFNENVFYTLSVVSVSTLYSRSVIISVSYSLC